MPARIRSLAQVVPIWAAVVVALCACAGGRGEPLAAEEPAVAAARRRQESVQRFVAEFTQTESQPGSASHQARTFTWRNRLKVEGDKVRLESNNPGWLNREPREAREGTCESFPFLMVLNGDTVKRYFRQGFADKDKPLIMITNPHALGNLREELLSPLLAAFRGMNSTHSLWPAGSMKPTGEMSTIGTLSCQKYVIPLGQFDQYHCWLDAGPEHLLRRVELNVRKKAVTQLDIEYEQRDTHTAPVRWVQKTLPAESEGQRIHSVEVQELQFDGPPQEAKTFDEPYEEGTEVRDFIKSMKYVVEPDGSLLEVSSIPAKGVPNAAPTADPWYENPFLLSVVALALATTFVLVYFLPKKKPHCPKRAASAAE